MMSTDTEPRIGDEIADDYVLKYIIGKGSTADVWMAQSQRAGRVVAIKIYRTEEYGEGASRVLLLSNILRASPAVQTTLFALSIEQAVCLNRQCIIYELFGMSLRELITKFRPSGLPNANIKGIMWQVFEGLQFLHSVEIVHTDIKPENILVKDDNLVKVIDLTKDGKFVEKNILQDPRIKIIDLDDAQRVSTPLRYISGSKSYRAPEVYGGIGWGVAVDIFSSGCLIYELCIGVKLLPATSNIHYLFAVMEKTIGPFDKNFADKFLKQIPSLFTSDRPRRVKISLQEFATKSLERRLHQTIAIGKSIDNSDLVELLLNCLKLNPSKRISAEGCLRHSYFNVTKKD